MRNFELEVFYSKWEFTTEINASGTDMESVTIDELLALSGATKLSALGAIHLGYTETWGHPVLRHRLAELYEKADQNDILCFAGAEEVLHGLMHAALTADDHAIVLTPNYQSAETLPKSICETTGVALNADRHWALDVGEIAAAIQSNTRLIYINFPNNPTGSLISHSELDEVVDIARQHGIILASDEIFRGQEHEPRSRLCQVADLYENGISLNGFSKLYGLPGIRIGWAASKNHALLEKMERLKHYGSICSSAPSEFLAIEALKAGERLIERNRNIGDTLMAAADTFFGKFPDLFNWEPPDAGYFAYPRYKGADGVESFVERVREELGVLFVPASVFQSQLTPTPTDRFRIGFTRSGLPCALDRLAAWLPRRT